MKRFICLWFVLSFIDLTLCPDHIDITAEPGQNVNLTCRAGRNGIVTAVRLTRDDLDPRYVLLYRDEQIDKDLLNPLYKGRTKLQSLISTDGKINLTLDNVTEKDSGEYECRVKTEIKSNTVIHLRVAATQSDPPGRGHIGLVLGLMVVALVVGGGIVVTAVTVLKKNSFHPPRHDEAENQTNQSPILLVHQEQKAPLS